jgi:putative hydrolase of the HAD superfamily
MGAGRWDAVAFDYGRVLSHSPSAEELRVFADVVGAPEAAFFQLYSDTRDEYDRGRHDCYGHWQRFARAAGIELARERIDRIVEFENALWTRANPQALELARDIKAHGVRTAILSNMPHDLLAALRSGFDWLDEFEVQIWSCEHGIIKPDRAIYDLCVAKLGYEPPRVLFFDDRPRNVEGARRAGLEAHVFESAEQARSIVESGMGLQTAISSEPSAVSSSQLRAHS